MTQKLISVFAFVFSMVFVNAQSGYKIQVSVEGFEGNEAYLGYHLGSKQYISDTTKTVGGAFTFAGDKILDQGIYLIVFPPNNNYFEVIVSEDQSFMMETKMNDFVGSMKIRGSEENELFYKDLRKISAFREEANSYTEMLKNEALTEKEKSKIQAKKDAIDKEVKTYRSSLVKNNPDLFYTKVVLASQNPIVPKEIEEQDKANGTNNAFAYYKKHFFDDFDFSCAGLIRTPLLNGKITTYMKRLTYQYNDSLIKSADYILTKAKADSLVFKHVLITLVNEFAASDVMGQDEIYVHLVEKYYLSGDAYWATVETLGNMKDRIESIKPNLIGAKAPNIIALDSLGNKKALADQKNTFTIIYFWTYDCSHCKKQTPELAKLYTDFKDKGVGLFMVNMDGIAEEWKAAANNYSDDLGVYVQDIKRESGAEVLYDLHTYPVLYLIDEEHKIIAKRLSPEQANDYLTHLLE